MSWIILIIRRLLPLGCLGSILFVAVASAREPTVAVPPEGAIDPVPDISAKAEIPRDALIGMYRVALGDRFHDADADRLYQAHQSIESYFQAATTAQRKQAVASIEQSGLDAGIIGPIIRLRMRWPALPGGVYYINEKRGPHDVRYFLGIPAGYDRTRAWPLVIQLPEIQPFLAQPAPTAEQVVKMYNGWINDELAHHPDALVLMPLLNLEELFGPSYAGMNGVMQSLFHAADRVNIDPARVYLMGHSTGALAVWNLALHYPTYFAAIAPLAGGAPQDWQRLRLANLRNTLPVVWADAQDKIVKPEFSRSLVNALHNLKLDVDYVETPSFGHTPPPAIVEERYQKMRGRVRELYPIHVTLRSNRPDVIFNREDWVQIWQESDPGKESHVLFRHAGSRMTVDERSAKIDAVREGNTIVLTLDNVESMRLYLNDQMVDFSQKLTIVINRKRTIVGWAKPNVEQMMNDQLFLGRGWRYYTAVLDIDLTDPSTTRPSAHAASQPATHTGKIIVGPAQ